MVDAARLPETRSAVVETYLLGQVDFHRAMALQRRLVSELRLRDDGQIALLFCEHPPLITVGRDGSPAAIATQSPTLRSRQIEVCWVNRGGACLVHGPGQLAIYPIVPLRWHGFRVGEYVQRLQQGLVRALEDLNIPASTRPGRYGVWGRTGQLAALGIAVRGWVAYFGAYLNVCPAMGLFRLVNSDTLALDETSMSCLVAERRGAPRMATVRAALVHHLTEAFGCDRYHLYTGHPALPVQRHEDGDKA